MKIFLLACLLSLNAFATSNSVVALVNDNVITFDAIAEGIKPNQTKAQKLALVNQQVDLALQLQEIKQIGIEPKSTSIEMTLNNIAIQNKLTFNQLQRLPEFNQIVKEITQELALRGLRQFVLKNIDFNLTPGEINTRMASQPNQLNKQIKIAQILINSIDNTSALTQTQDQLIEAFLLSISDKINSGESFSALAKLHSQDPSYRNGGKSEWIDIAQLPTLFKQHLSPGKLSKPFKTSQGWHIIKIIDTQKVNGNLIKTKAQLIRAKQDVYFNNWVKALRKDAYIEIFDHKF